MTVKIEVKIEKEFRKTEDELIVSFEQVTLHLDDEALKIIADAISKLQFKEKNEKDL